MFSDDGEQRNRGLELTSFGEVLPGVRLLGGLSLIDGVQLQTPGGVDEGKKAVGEPVVNLNLGADYDVPRLTGLTLTGRVIYTSKQYYDASNTQSIPDWTELDLGVRYAFAVQHHPTTLRLNVNNVANTKYWESTNQQELSYGPPRTYRLSVSVAY